MSRNLTDAERAESDRILAEKFAEMWECADCAAEFRFGRMTGAWAGYCVECHSPNIRKAPQSVQ